MMSSKLNALKKKEAQRRQRRFSFSDNQTLNRHIDECLNEQLLKTID